MNSKCKQTIIRLLTNNSRLRMHSRQSQYTVMIGYYNLRGKAQVPRLLCEYLGVKYEDKVFSLSEWNKYKGQKAKEWNFVDLPFIKEGSFVVSDSVPICIYLINRFGNSELLGRGLKDSSIVDMYLWTIDSMSNVISINCQQKSAEELSIFKKQQWENNVLPRLKKLEQAATPHSWFLDYLTVIDFSIYELMRYMEYIFGEDTEALPKLKAIKDRFSLIPAINIYEHSTRAIIQWCPMRLLQQLERPQPRKEIARKQGTLVLS